MDDSPPAFLRQTGVRVKATVKATSIKGEIATVEAIAQ
jgi:hypothetical protein